ncbi:MAG: outer membrane beta-barrel protein [Sphingomicrobium sp.]
MKKFLSIALAATAFVAAPAMAQTADATFTGPRIGANVGFADDNIFGTEAFTYGAEVGYDFAAGGAVLGLTAEIQDNKDITRELALTARAGARVGSNGLLYATGGYSNIRVSGINVDGFRLGVGGELAIGGKAFAKVEQRYGNYQYGIDLWQSLVGVGVRF